MLKIGLQFELCRRACCRVAKKNLFPSNDLVEHIESFCKNQWKERDFLLRDTIEIVIQFLA